MEYYQLIEEIRGLLKTQQVGGITRVLSFPLTTTASVYTAGDSLGGSIKIDGGSRGGGAWSGIVQSVSIIGEDDATAVVTGATVYFFKADPGAVDQTAFDPSDAVMATKIPGFVALNTTDHLTEFGDRDTIEKTEIVIPYSLLKDTSLWAVIVVNGAWDPNATDEHLLNIGLFLD